VSTFALNCSPVFDNVELQFTPIISDMMQADDTERFTYFQLPQGKKLWQWAPKEDIPFIQPVPLIQPVSHGSFVTWSSPTGLVLRDLQTGHTLGRISNFVKTDGFPFFDRKGRYMFGMNRRGFLKRWHLK
jgi:hypothetical protein